MKKIYLAAFMLLGGFAVFILGSPYYSVFITNRNKLYLIVLSLVLLLTAVLMYRNHSLQQYWTVSYALFIACAATLFLNTGILNIPYDGANELKDIAIDKFGQFCHIVPVILIFTFTVKDDLASLFITKGDLKRGLLFGIVSFYSF